MWTLRLSGEGSFLILFYHMFKNVLTSLINLAMILSPQVFHRNMERERSVSRQHP